MERRRLLTLCTHLASPGLRFRIQTWEPHLARAGIDTTYHVFNTPELEGLIPQPGRTAEKAARTLEAYARYAWSAPRLDDFDAVLVYRDALPFGPPWWERYVAARRPVAYDVDDPVFIPGVSQANPLSSKLRSRHKWKSLCRLAKVTICINDPIAEYMAPLAQKVVVVPNAIDLGRYPLKPSSPPRARPVIGFCGSHATVSQLEVIRGALGRLATEHPFSLEVVGGRAPYGLEGAPVVERTWTAEGEAALLHGFDIGVAPAPDDVWNRYKYFVKVLLYMAVGLPVVASAIGSPTRIIQDGVNGFLAADEDEWLEKLSLLVKDPLLRARMGAAARKTIETGYVLDAQVPRVVRVFRQLTGLEQEPEAMAAVA